MAGKDKSIRKEKKAPAKPAPPTPRREKKLRPPVVTVMGHVDHGKTSLLDAIRQTNVTAKEEGGITQHIGASQVTYQDQKITFIDTPGHEAFTEMRARGGQAADLVVLVVAADAGVKPQTREAISHIKAAQVPLVVALNKIDLPSAKPEKVKRELADAGVALEGYGGEVVSVEVSAKTKKGLDNLLEAILLIGEMAELSDTPEAPLSAVVIESRLDSRRGVVVNVVVKTGTLRVGEMITAGGVAGKVKALTDHRGQPVRQAFPADPAEILGFKEVLPVGSVVTRVGEVPTEEVKPRPAVIEKSKAEVKAEAGETESAAAKPDEAAAIEGQAVPVEPAASVAGSILKLVVKADTQGTLEALLASLGKLGDDEARLQIVHAGVGDVNDSDILLAIAAEAIVVAFNVKVPTRCQKLAADHRAIIRIYPVIYKLLEEIAEALEGVLELKEEKIKGRGEVIALFPLPSGDIIAGVNLFAGRMRVGDAVTVWENEEALKEYLKDPETSAQKPLHEAKIKRLKHEKETIASADKGRNYGILLNPQFVKIAKGHVLEVG